MANGIFQDMLQNMYTGAGAQTPQQQQNTFSGVMGGALQGVAPMMGQTSRPYNNAQILAGIAGGMNQGMNQSRQNNLQMQQAAQQKILQQQQIDANKASAKAAQASADRMAQFRKNNPEYANMPKAMITEAIKAQANPFGNNTGGKMWEYYKQGPSHPNYKIAVAYLSQDKAVQTTGGTMMIPAPLLPDGSLKQSVPSAPTQGAMPPSATPQQPPAPNAVGLPQAQATPQPAIAPAPLSGSPSIVPGTDPASKKQAELGVQAEFDEKQKLIENQKVYSGFENSLSNVAAAFGGTETGYFAGMIPAITSGQQSLEIALAQIQPVLKSLFREKGEGTFSEGDQRILLELIPGRGTQREVALDKLQDLDNGVRSRLGLPKRGMSGGDNSGITIIKREKVAN